MSYKSSKGKDSVSDVFFTIRNLSNISRQKVSGADTLKIIKGGGIGKEWK